MLHTCNNFFQIWPNSSILLQGITVLLHDKNQVRHEKYHKYRIEGHENISDIPVTQAIGLTSKHSKPTFKTQYY